MAHKISQTSNVLLFAAFLILLASSDIKGQCTCPAVLDPVCGSDGRTYNNECEAICAGVTWTRGECSTSEPCVCPAVVDPVCGSDGRTYNNECEAICAGVTWTRGACTDPCVCPAVYDPVCGADGITYNNECEAICAGVTWTRGECRDCSNFALTVNTGAASCGTLGTATAIASGGTAPYTYNWSTGRTGATLTNLNQGSYRVTATDSRGCTSVRTFTISGSSLPVLRILSTNTSCSLNNGSVTAIGTNGRTPYTYRWSNGQSSATITGLSAGTYTVTLTDANGCVATRTVAVNNSGNLNLTVSTVNATCIQPLGTATANVTAGSSPYVYRWSSGQSGASVSLAPGSYSVTVADQNNCSVTRSFSIENNCSTNCINPIANFDYTVDSSGRVSFQNLSQNNTNCIWKFGNNDTSQLCSPTYTYNQSGSFEVTLIVRNDCASDTVKRTIDIRTGENTVPRFGLIIGSVASFSGDTVCVPIIVNARESVLLSSVQGNIFANNPSVAKILNIVSHPNLVVIFNDGRFSGIATNLKLNQGDTLFCVKTLVSGNPGDASLININNELTGFEVSIITNGIVEILRNVPVQTGTASIRLNALNISGSIKTYLGSPIKGVNTTVEQENNITTSIISNENGLLDRQSVPFGRKYIFTPTKDSNPANGLSTAGIYLIRDFIIGRRDPALNSPFQLVAADANCDGIVTSVDLSIMQRLIVGIETTFAQCPSWVFMPEAIRNDFIMNVRYYANYPYPKSITVDNASVDINADFIGVKVGDVLNRANTQQLNHVAFRTGGILPLLMHKQADVNEDDILIEIKMSDARRLLTYQFALQYDPNILELIEVIPSEQKSLLAGVPKPGTIAFSWYSLSGGAETFDISETLAKLRFRKKVAFVDYRRMLELDITALGSEAFDASWNKLDIQLKPLEPAKTSAHLYQNKPNPFNNDTRITFELQEETEAILTIYNRLGQVIQEHKAQYTKGLHEILFSNDRFSPGVYYYSLKTPHFIATKSMILQK